MQNNVLAKLQRPDTDNVVLRQRLFRTLDHARKKKSIWITGLPGAGKTTLVASYIASNKIPHAWYHIDSADSDPATFFHYLKYLVKGNDGAKNLKLPALTPEYLPNISVFTQRYFENLYAMLPRGFVLVFDNYHEINQSPLFHTIMSEALMRVPERGTVILISRSEPHPVYTRLRANSLMEVIDRDSIKFTPEETRELIRMRSGNVQDRQLMERLYQWTDGWAAGIMLMLTKDSQGLKTEAHSGSKDYQAIFDYFSSEIFQRLGPDIQDFLLKTCFFRSMTVEMAKRITGDSNSERILNGLVKDQYFTVRRQDNTYTYHDLFREFLVIRAREKYSEAELQHIYQQSGLILKENGRFEDAVELLKKSENVNDIRAIIQEQAHTLITQGRNKILELWIMSLPEVMIHQDPWLLYWSGEARAVFNPVEARTYFERSFKKFLHDTPHLSRTNRKKYFLSAGVYLSWIGIIETFIYEYGNFALIDKWVMEMIKIIQVHHEFPSRDLEERTMSLMVFALTHYNPYHAKLKFWADRSLRLLKHIKNSDQFVNYSFSIVHYYAWIGDVSHYQTLIEFMQTIPQSLSIKNQLLQKMYHAGYARQIVSKEECLRVVSEGMEMAHTYGVRFLDNMIISQAVYLLFAINDLRGVEKYLQQMEAVLNQSNALQVSQFSLLSGWLDYLQGNTSLALEKIERSLALSIKAHIPFAQGLCRLALAQILYDQGDDKEAKKQYNCGFKIAKGMKSKSLEFTSYYIQAYWLLDEKHTNDRETENKGLKMLKKCLVLGKKYGMVNVYFAWGQKMTSLCLKALENNIEVNYVQHLIQKLELFPDTPPYPCENWPWTFRIHTLGNFKIFHDDVPTEFSKKLQLKPIELLQFLIVNHERAVELDHISGMLWSDAEGDYAHQTLDTTIHRLRKLLGSNDAVIVEAGRLMLNPALCWVDVQAFAALFDSMEKLLRGRDTTMTLSDRDNRVRGLAKRIFNLYKGDFFMQVFLPSWAISFRDRLHDRFMHFIDILGSYYEQSGDTVQAVRIYRKGLEIENQAELLYQRLMLLYQSLGRTAEAVSTYKQCQSALSGTLGIEPSEKTRALYTSIKGTL